MIHSIDGLSFKDNGYWKKSDGLYLSTKDNNIWTTLSNVNKYSWGYGKYFAESKPSGITYESSGGYFRYSGSGQSYQYPTATSICASKNMRLATKSEIETTISSNPTTTWLSTGHPTSPTTHHYITVGVHTIYYVYNSLHNNHYRGMMCIKK
jgi:hypothetical protein